VQDIYAGCYSGQDILRGVTLRVNDGAIASVIGANGVSKSTEFKAIYRIIPVGVGSALCSDREITNIPPQQTLKTANAA